ncbi:integrase arm-type DNA-binding domain-containing protein [Pseudomonas sp. ME-P-057]|jgi:hypothetical protein|uniref:integrase arm-type DNA-binding domain-containing protein n=1 Tax=Pseudomonas sp. ME-P-057 TaxID=3040321 RepID=UPI003306EE75
MPAPALRLSDCQLKAVKAKDNDYVLSDGDCLQLRVRSNGSGAYLSTLLQLPQPVIKNRINTKLGAFPEVSLAHAQKNRGS